MPSRALPGLGLTGFWDLGASDWKPGMDANLRMLSALVQASVLSSTTALPGSPANGDMYIVPSDAGSNANEIAIRDADEWVYLTPSEGFHVYVIDTDELVRFDGAGWVASGGEASYPDFTGKSGLFLKVNDAETGVEWADPVARPANPDAIVNHASGHSAGSTDVTLGFTPTEGNWLVLICAATSTAHLPATGWTRHIFTDEPGSYVSVAIMYKQVDGDDTDGVITPWDSGTVSDPWVCYELEVDDLPSRIIDAYTGGWVSPTVDPPSLTATTGAILFAGAFVREATNAPVLGPTTWDHSETFDAGTRKCVEGWLIMESGASYDTNITYDGGNSTGAGLILLDMAASETPAAEFPTMLGNAGRVLAVNDTEDGAEWIDLAPTTLAINTQSDDYTLNVGDASSTYVRMNKATAVNLTVPPDATVSIPVGTAIPIRSVGAGQTTLVEGSGVTINTPETLKLRKQGSGATLIKVATDEWDLVGDLELLV